MGQDPYPNNNFATGLAFAIPPGIEWQKWPASLQVIGNSIQTTCNGLFDDHYGKYLDQELIYWEEQGVLLLNRYLTCEPNEASKHKDLWNWFMPKLIRMLSDYNPDLIYYLLGNPAKELFSNIDKSLQVFTDYHPAYVARQIKAGNKGFRMQGEWQNIADIYKEIHGKELRWFYPF